MPLTKKERDDFKKIQVNLTVLQERTKRLKQIIRKKKSKMNLSDKKRLKNKIKKAKLHIADAEFLF